MSNPFVDMQNDLAAKLLADSYFSNVPVLTQNLGDLQNQVDTAMSGTGVCVVIVTPVANAKWKNMQLYFDRVKMIARVIENVELNQGSNGTQKGALDVASKVATLLHLHRPAGGIFESVVVDDPTLVLAADPTPGRLSYDVRLVTMAGLTSSTPTPRVTDPAIASDGGGHITISGATAGASVWYTVDTATSTVNDTNYPNAVVGTLYTGTFTVTPPVIVRARAWIYGYNPSKVIQQLINA